MASYVGGPIVAVMGTAEGVIVKAKELLAAVFARGEGTSEVTDQAEEPHE